jgi:hypothetical protein
VVALISHPRKLLYDIPEPPTAYTLQEESTDGGVHIGPAPLVLIEELEVHKLFGHPGDTQTFKKLLEYLFKRGGDEFLDFILGICFGFLYSFLWSCYWRLYGGVSPLLLLSLLERVHPPRIFSSSSCITQFRAVSYVNIYHS